MPTFQEKIIKEYEDFLANNPYVPYGAGIKQKAEELIKKSKKGQRPAEGAWNFKDTFTDDEMRLMLEDDNFAKEMLQAYDPKFENKEPKLSDIRSFKKELSNYYAEKGIKIKTGIWSPTFLNNPNEISEKIRKDEISKIRNNALEMVKERRSPADEAASVLQRASRLAPLSSLHTTAKSMIQGNNPSESFNLGKQEIAAAGQKEIPNEISQYLQKASETPESFIKQYEVDYEPLINKYRTEARKDFLEKDIPSINKQFASKGAFYSGAREAAINKAKVNKEERIERDIQKLLLHGREEAMKNYHQYRSGHLSQAQIAGHAHQAEKQNRLGMAEALRVNAATEQAAKHQQATAASQLGRVEQEQAQREIDIRKNEADQERQRKLKEIAEKAALYANTPLPHGSLTPATEFITPPNPLGVGAGMLGQLYGGVQPAGVFNPYTKAATGGHIRKYAAGDSVARAGAQLQQMNNYIQESPEEAEMRQSAEKIKNHRANPMGDFFFTMGSHQLANSRTPLKAFGEGSSLGMKAYKDAQESNLMAQERAANLMNKVNQSKMYTRDFISKHHAMMQNHEEMVRHHKAQENESRRAHDIMQQHYNSKDMQSSKPVKMSATERKLVNKSKNDLKGTQNLIRDLDKMTELLSETKTGPWIGAGKERLGIDDKITKLGNDIVVKAQQNLSNIRGSAYLMELLKSTKPGLTSSMEANNILIESIRQGAVEAQENAILELLEMGWNPEQIKKKLKVDVPSHLLEEEAPNEAQDEKESLPQNLQEKQQLPKPEMVKMIAPDGGKLIVPAEKVEELSKLGANIVK